jgi:RNA polymerase sigma factor (sigma-70 family)
MSAPQSVDLDLASLGLDDLAVLARHPLAPAATRTLFTAALSRWVRQRVATATRGMTAFDAAERDDLVQEFLVTCLTRHLRQWDPQRCPLSAFLYVRLRGAAIDGWRRHRRAQRHGALVEVDLDTVVDPDSEGGSGERGPRARTLDGCCAAMAAAVQTLPRRQRAVVEHVLQGHSLVEAAAALKVHPSTASRERSAALASLRGALDPYADDAASLWAA